jgi:histidine triad (HIT) family protein
MMAGLPLQKSELLSLALAVASLRFLRPLVTFFYPHMHRFLPLEHLAENDHWMAVYHPQPEYPLHILILPKGGISSLTSAPSDDAQLYADLIQLVQVLISDFSLAQQGYRLITNGGEHQSIPIWHWHLICDTPGQDRNQPGVSHA